MPAVHPLLRQGARYLVVGGIVFLCDFFVFAALLFVAPTLLIAANLAGKAAGAALGFVLHRHWTFAGAHRDSAPRQIAAYLLLLAFNMAASSALLWVLAEAAGIWPPAAKLIADGVVIVTAFVAGRTLVFRPPGGPDAWQHP